MSQKPNHMAKGYNFRRENMCTHIQSMSLVIEYFHFKLFRFRLTHLLAFLLCFIAEVIITLTMMHKIMKEKIETIFSPALLCACFEFVPPTSRIPPASNELLQVNSLKNQGLTSTLIKFFAGNGLLH